MKKLLKTTLISILGIGALFYAALYGFDVEKKVVYDPISGYKPTNADIASKVTIDRLINKDGQYITYWYIKGEKEKPAVIYSHGNADNISYFQDKIEFLVKNGYTVFMYDYRGYGNSEGKPSEEGLYRDLESMIDLAKNKYHFAQNEIILWGHSLGGAVTIDVASRMNFKAVILEATFTKLNDVKKYAAKFKSHSKGEEIFNYFLYNSIPLSQKFESIDKIANIQSPTFIIHSKPDDTIPYWMSEKLAEKNPKSNLYLSETGNHDEQSWSNKIILNYLNELK